MLNNFKYDYDFTNYHKIVWDLTTCDGQPLFVGKLDDYFHYT